MSEELIRSRVRSFITNRFPAAAARSISDEVPLLDSGVVDSLGVLDIVGFLDAEFGMEIDDSDLSPENFASIASIAQFVAERKRA